MTNLEKLRLRRDAINDEIAEAEKQEVAESLRASFAKLADPELPVCEIMLRVLGNRRSIPPSELPKFAERLAETVKAHLGTIV